VLAGRHANASSETGCEIEGHGNLFGIFLKDPKAGKVAVKNQGSHSWVTFLFLQDSQIAALIFPMMIG